MNAFALALRQAANGPLAQGDLISIRKNAKLRVTYNWLYSALNVDPNDTSSFPWIMEKRDDTHVTLSPVNGYGGRKLYASVRPDWNWQVQTQAPHSADWITGIGADEILGFASPGLQLLRFTGLNGQFVAVNEDMARHQWHSGYVLRSAGSQYPDAYTWFFAVSAVLQPGLQIATAAQLTSTDIRNALTSAGLDDSDTRVSGIRNLLS